MDMKREEVAVYVSTLQAIIDLMNNTPNATIKKIRDLLEVELGAIRGKIQEKSH